MTIQVTEVAGSRTVAKPTSGDRSGSRTFVVYDDSGLFPTMDDMLLATGMPTYNDPHPDNDSLFAGGYNFQLNDERANTWLVTWSYTPFLVNADEEEEPPDPEFVGFDAKVTQTIVDMWRSNPLLPTDINDPPSPPDDTAAASDIGGKAVHTMGYPISGALPRADITLKSTLVSSNFQGYGFLASVSKRNSNTWLGFPAGSVLFKGVNIVRTAPTTYDLTWDLTWDYWIHLRQSPDRDIDGNPKIDQSDPSEMYVFFKQPFPLTVDFGFLPNV